MLEVRKAKQVDVYPNIGKTERNSKESRVHNFAEEMNNRIPLRCDRQASVMSLKPKFNTFSLLSSKKKKIVVQSANRKQTDICKRLLHINN